MQQKFEVLKGFIPSQDFTKSEFKTAPLSFKAKEDTYTRQRRFPATVSAKDPQQKMLALVWHGKDDVRVESKPRPLITEPGDAIIRVTASTICGSDLHLYHNELGFLETGDILGHESMGIVEAIGDDVKNIKRGDRVVVSAVIADGKCFYCQNGLYSLCDNTNPSKEMEAQYGHRTAGIFGYSHLTGGYEGGQAEYMRVPLADFNTLKVPDSIPDEKALFLSDIACTGWHANELGGVGEGCTVAIWGAGPVGLMAAMWARFRKAERIIMIDGDCFRLQFARDKLGVDVIDRNKSDVYEQMRQLLPHGPDVVIDCVGFRFPKSTMHKVARTLKLETDTPEVLNEAIKCCRKGGTLSVIGDYFKTANDFAIGPLMEKGITFRGGQVYVHKYWKQLLNYIEKGWVDPSFVITHKMTLDKTADAYKMFDNHEDKMIKVLLTPPSSSTFQGSTQTTKKEADIQK